MEFLRKEGLPGLEDLTEEVTKLEEDIIQKEIVPMLTKTIEPVLQPVKRELVLVVDYVPGQPLSIHVSRKRNMSAEPHEVEEDAPHPHFEHKTIKCSPKKDGKGKNTRLRVTLSSGEVIEEPFATDTFRLFVLHVGIEKVFALGLSQSNVPLVTTVLDDKYRGAQKLLKDGWYLMTNSPTTKKKKVIEQIAAAVGIWVKVEIV